MASALPLMDKELERLNAQYVQSALRARKEKVRETSRCAYYRAHCEMLLKEEAATKQMLSRVQKHVDSNDSPPLETTPLKSSSETFVKTDSSSSKKMIRNGGGFHLPQWLCDSRCFGHLIEPNDSWFVRSNRTYFVILRNDRLTFYKNWTQAKQSYFNKKESSNTILVRCVGALIPKSFFSSLVLHTLEYHKNRYVIFRVKSKRSFRTSPRSRLKCREISIVYFVYGSYFFSFEKRIVHENIHTNRYQPQKKSRPIIRNNKSNNFRNVQRDVPRVARIGSKRSMMPERNLEKRQG